MLFFPWRKSRTAVQVELWNSSGSWLSQCIVYFVGECEMKLDIDKNDAVKKSYPVKYTVSLEMYCVSVIVIPDVLKSKE